MMSADTLNDEEILSQLVSEPEVTLASWKNAAFKDRLLSDFHNDNPQWWTLVERVRTSGFHIPESLSQRQQFTPQIASVKMPVRFQDDPALIDAVAAILSISEAKALELTLGALSSLSVPLTDTLQYSLELLLNIVEYYYKQRLARLSVVAELLRLEHTGDYATTSILRELDQSNLFRLLLNAAFPQESKTLSRKQTQAISKLCNYSSFNMFASNLGQIQKVLIWQSQPQRAMEALLALCYQYLTLQRCHLAILGNAMLPQNDIVALLSVEGLALWRDSADHPLLNGEEALRELHLLGRLWQNQCLQSRAAGLVVLGLGLLLVHQPESTSLINAANDYDALGYLHQLMSRLVVYDGQSEELNSTSLMYASVGRELVSAAIDALKERVLSNEENVDILCMLASLVTCNSPMLTSQFWAEWQLFASTSREPALCLLMVAAHRFAVQNKSVVSLLRFSSSLVSSPQHVEVILKDFLPDNILSNSLKAVGMDRDVAVRTVSTLSKHATTASSRESLCQALDPRHLTQALVESTNGEVRADGLEALSLLIQDNLLWTQQVARSIIHWGQQADDVWRRVVFQSNATIGAAARLLSRLFVNMTNVLFAPSCNELYALDFLTSFRSDLTPITSQLASAVPMLSKPTLVSHTQLSYESAAAIMECIRLVLQYSGPLELLHPSPKVRQAAAHFRWSILSNTEGKSVTFFALAPVTLGIVQKLDSSVRDVEVVRARMQSNMLETWMTGSKQETKSSEAGQEVLDILTGKSSLSFDFKDLTLEPGDSAKSPLRAALAAFKLLEQQSLVVEQRLREDESTSSGVLSCSPFHFLAKNADLPHLHTDSERAVLKVWNDLKLSCISLIGCFVRFASRDKLDEEVAVQAMDYLVTATTHAVQARNETFFNAFFDSTGLLSMLRDKVKDGVASFGKKKDAIILQALAVMSNCAMVSPRSTLQHVGLDQVKGAADVVKQMTEGLVEMKEGGMPMTSESLVEELQLVCGCLDLVVSLKKASAQLSPSSQIDTGMSLIPALLRVISVCAPEKGHGCNESVMKFLRLSIDLISNELALVSWTPNEDNSLQKNKQDLIRSFEQFFDDSLVRIVALSPKYLKLRHFPSLADKFTSVWMSVSPLKQLSASNVLERFGKTTSVKTLKGFQNHVDVKFSSAWLSALGKDKISEFTDCFKLYYLARRELELMGSWKSMVTLLTTLEDSVKWRGANKQSQVLSVAMKREGLLAMHQNLAAVQAIQPPSLLLKQTREIIVGMPGLLVQSRMDDKWVDIVDLTARCCTGILNCSFAPEDSLLSIKQLLTCSLAMLSSSKPNFDETAVGPACLALTEIASRLIRVMEQRREEDLECLSICVSVLACLTPEQRSHNNSWRGVSGYSDGIFKVLKDYDIIHTLSGFVSTALSLKENKSDQSNRELCDANLLVLAFFSKLAAIGGADMLAHIVESDVALVLPKGTQFSMHSELSFPMRGYKHDPNKEGHQLFRKGEENHRPTVERGTDNPDHKVWRSSLQFVATALRSATQMSADPHTKTKYYTMALDFLTANKASILSCLKQCSSIYFDQEYPVLTINAVRETALVLSLVNELCAQQVIDVFKSNYKDLYVALLDFSKSLLASLGSFIGSSESSRDIFRCIDRLDDEDPMAMDSAPHLASLGSMFYVLANGINNTRHEAIRYSHFVSRCLAPVTASDIGMLDSFPPQYKVDGRQRTSSDPKSLSSVEEKCRVAVTSTFAFVLEWEAAKALFFCVSILWRTHPTFSSLVMFDEEDASSLDFMKILKKGVNIAIKPHLPTDSKESISLVQIVNCDTINRRWEVRSWEGATPHYSIVTSCQIVGIEDSSRRRACLSYNPARRSSAELEKTVGMASVGHLILVLRWCGRYENVVGDASIATRLAEVCTVLLLTELSIHRESGNRSKEDLDTLALQVVDLFGDESDFAELLLGLTGELVDHRRGRLKQLLTKGMWMAARMQLYDELQWAKQVGREQETRSRNMAYQLGNSPHRSFAI